MATLALVEWLFSEVSLILNSRRTSRSDEITEMQSRFISKKLWMISSRYRLDFETRSRLISKSHEALAKIEVATRGIPIPELQKAPVDSVDQQRDGSMSFNRE